MPKEKQPPKELKVTDKRIFTPDGDIREEFKSEIAQGAAQAAPAAEKPEPPPEPKPAAEPPRAEKRAPEDERRRSMAEKGSNPETPFANFIQSLVMQTYMFLGMLRDPRSPQPMFDAAAARETIDILTLLKEKTAGNLTPEEQEFFDVHLGELKLAFVQRTKSI